jgi:GT2 family glycosyltransferase
LESREQPFVSIVIPTYRRPDALRATLESVTAVDYPPERWEVVVVDDGSGDETPEVVRAFAGREPAVVYEGQENAGVATARNRGAARARGEVLVFLDDDTLVEPDHIRQHLATREAHGDCLVNGHRPFTAEVERALAATPFGRFRLWLAGWVEDRIAKRPLSGRCVEPEGVTACNLGLRRELFLELGGFDESFPMAGCEDQEFSHRAARAGCRFVYNYDIRLAHNDERLTLEQFCRRQREEALTKVHLARVHPEDFAGHPMLVENGPVAPGDPWALRARKRAKAVLARPAGLAAARRVIAVLERVAPRSRLLARSYWAMCGLHIFLGVREGLAAPQGPADRRPARLAASA